MGVEVASGVGKVVFPVAGLGTRFLPATKALPKEMLPLVDKPLIQYAAEEALAAGARTLIFVTGRFEHTLASHFNAAPELEAGLRGGDKRESLEQVQRILPPGVECVYVNQPEPKGLGDAVYRAREAVGDAPFGVILPDDLIQTGPPGTLARMAALHERGGAAVVAVEAVPAAHTSRYGIVSIRDVDGQVAEVRGMVEKPSPDQALSKLAVVGRYILPARIFDLLERAGPGAGGEIQLTDAIAALLDEQPVLAYRFPGTRFDCGSKLGYVQATVSYALEHPELRREFVAFLHTLDLHDAK